MNSQDGYSYLAKMQQGARGDWSFHLPYTSEDHDGGFVYTFHLALGRFSSAFGLPPILTYHLARLATGTFLLVAVYFAALELFGRADRAWACFLITALSSGLGWLTSLFGHLSSDMLIPESITYYAILANPHFPLGIGLLLVTFISFLKAIRQNRARYAVVAGLLTLLEALVQPFLVITVYVVVFGWLIWRWLTLRRLRLTELGYGALVVCIPIPGLVSDFIALFVNPLLREWSSQNLTPSPPPYDFLLGYGLVGVLAAFGIVYLWRLEKPLVVSPEARQLLLIWVLATVVLLYVPFSLQRRMAAGFHVALSLLATIGFYGYIVPHLPSLRLRKRSRHQAIEIATEGKTELGSPPQKSSARGMRAGMLALAVAAMVPSNIFLLGFTALGAGSHSYPLYLRNGEADAFRWLSENTSVRDTVIASEKTGNIIPALAGNRVFYGHPMETVRAEEKRVLLARFFGGTMSGEEVKSFLSAYNTALVYYGRSEREMGSYDPASKTYLQRIFENGDATIYRVVSTAMAGKP